MKTMKRLKPWINLFNFSLSVLAGYWGFTGEINPILAIGCVLVTFPRS